MTQKDFWSIIKETGVLAHDYESLLNLLSVLYDNSAKCLNVEAQFKISYTDVKRCEELAEIHKRKSSKIYDSLDKRGYYDDI